MSSSYPSFPYLEAEFPFGLKKVYVNDGWIDPHGRFLPHNNYAPLISLKVNDKELQNLSELDQAAEEMGNKAVPIIGYSVCIYKSQDACAVSGGIGGARHVSATQSHLLAVFHPNHYAYYTELFKDVIGGESMAIALQYVSQDQTNKRFSRVQLVFTEALTTDWNDNRFIFVRYAFETVKVNTMGINAQGAKAGNNVGQISFKKQKID